MKQHNQDSWHHLNTDEVVQLLDVDLDRGLTGDEVRKRQANFGKNLLTSRKGTPEWKKFLLQFHSPPALYPAGRVRDHRLFG